MLALLSSISFASPLLLLGLLALPAIWWIMRLTPPRPREMAFGAFPLLKRLAKAEETPQQTPWWLLLLRMLIAALVIIALAGPVLFPASQVSGLSERQLFVIDNDWTSRANFDSARDQARGMLESAGRDSAVVAVVSSVQPATSDLQWERSATAIERLNALAVSPTQTDWTRLGAKVAELIGESAEPVSLIWFTSRSNQAGRQAFATQIQAQSAGQVLIDIHEPATLGITDVDSAADSMNVTLRRADPAAPASATLVALDRNRSIIETAEAQFEADQNETLVAFELPVEVRNDVTQIRVNDQPSAGAVRLLDGRQQRRNIGLAAASDDARLELLAPLHYVERALEPSATLYRSAEQQIGDQIADFIRSKMSVIILADIAQLSEEDAAALNKWAEGGGVVVRFAGPKMAGSEQHQLMPVAIRTGGRSLGGSLSWSDPQPLGEFDANGPFAGLPISDEVLISQQLLAVPDAQLNERTWARLDDGTPLVTGQQLGRGWLTLFHVTAETSWSNLPISGIFVQMLERLSALSSNQTGIAAGRDGAELLPAHQVLNGDGQLVAPDTIVEPATVDLLRNGRPTPENPPGYYGEENGRVSFNLLNQDDNLVPLPLLDGMPDAQVVALAGAAPVALERWLLLAALMLLMLDSLVFGWLAGLTRARWVKRGAVTAGALALIITQVPTPSMAQDAPLSDLALEAYLRTHLAFVLTDDQTVNEVSRQGLRGLSQELTQRTAVEPGAPHGLDIGTDELKVYPLIYWPITEGASALNEAEVANVNSYLRSGGTILFDTRDESDAMLRQGALSAQGQRLRDILLQLEIPDIETVPPNHVVTKSFFILEDFPGLWSSGPFWVAVSDTAGDSSQVVRRDDGVSPLLITSNDFASAWAVDESNQPMFPIPSSDRRQRDFAYRAGINIVMYVLTGNYKADQVHLPALLERLGQ